MKVKLAYPNMPNDAEIEVSHLGVFKNNETHELDELQVGYWENETGREWPEGGVLEIPDQEVQAVASVGTDVNFPVHKGGGIYLLSDGTAVKGKEEAESAQDELNQGPTTPEENGGE